MNIKDFKWTEKRFGTRFAKILKGLGFSDESTEDIKVTDANGSVKTLVTDSNFKSILAKNGTLTKVTYQELKDKRDAGKLTPGALYRITDYNCTTTQKKTQSAGHQFDIVLLALSENKLAEEGWAMMHDGVDMFDDYDIYTITFNDGVSKQVYYKVIGGTAEEPDDEHRIIDTETFLGNSIWHDPARDGFVINTENKTATNNYLSSTEFEEFLVVKYPYNYFQNSNLSAWKIWYCLDNDKTRFAWADDSVNTSVTINDNYIRYKELDGDEKFSWHNTSEDIIFTDSDAPAVGDNIYRWDRMRKIFIEIGTVQNVETSGTGLPNGRGVIYRLVDEFNNDIKYDFKNIQFNRKLTDGQYDENGTETWCYTLNIWYNDMCQDASIVGNTLPNDEGSVNGVYNNKFGCATAFDLYIEGVNTFAYVLGNNVVLSFCEDEYYYGIYSNTIGNSFTANTIGTCFNSNIIGNNFHHNKVGNNFYSNIIGNNFCNITISDDTSDKNYGNRGVELATKDDLN